ncbi:cupin domain-containing protein [Parasphingorhabdus pacifica]
MQRVDGRDAEVFHASDMFSAGSPGVRFVELTRTEALSVGTYSIRSGCADPQGPHREDEVYVVLAGKARFVAETWSVPITTGATIVVPAGLRHHFEDVEQDLRLMVLFAPPESDS